MSKSQRLFDLMQILRRHRYPVAGSKLAEEAGVSLRTLYRDIAELQALGARIDGERGLGYVLQPGFLLPPLMFSEQEIQALALGAQWVSRQTDEEFAFAAREALVKIGLSFPRNCNTSCTTTHFTWPAGRSERKPSTLGLCAERCRINTSFRSCTATPKVRKPPESFGRSPWRFSIPGESSRAGVK